MARTNNKAPSRRAAMRTVLAAVGLAALGYSTLGHSGKLPETVTVWKTPNCGCCKDWVIHLRKEGFDVVTMDVSDTAPVRQKLGCLPSLALAIPHKWVAMFLKAMFPRKT